MFGPVKNSEESAPDCKTCRNNHLGARRNDRGRYLSAFKFLMPFELNPVTTHFAENNDVSSSPNSTLQLKMRESIFVPRLAIVQDMLSLKMRSVYNELRLKSVHVFPHWRVGVAAACTRIAFSSATKFGSLAARSRFT